MSKTLSCRRRWQLSISLLAFILASVSFYFQYAKGLQPCPLCLIQRYALIIIGIVYLAATGLPLKRIYLWAYAGIGFIITLTGWLAAARQIWLQNHQNQSIENCIPGVTYLLRAFPAKKIFQLIASSSTNCANVSWQFLGLSMAGWSFIAFSGLSILIIWHAITQSNE